MGPKRSKNQLRREKAKLRKLDKNGTNKQDPSHQHSLSQTTESASSVPATLSDPSVNKDDLIDQPHSDNRNEETTSNEELAAEFATIFKKFDTPSTSLSKPMTALVNKAQPESEGSLSDEENYSESEGQYRTLSKSRKRKLNSVPMAELKASTSKPQLVEWFDSDAPDPYLVVLLRTRLNCVDVPSHWQQKKDYLSAKRGASKPPYTLPKFIQDTGIAEMRNHDPESLKKLQRDRVQPKMNKLDIDYQRLYDAFFKHQTKPRLLAFGELYSEGREKTDQHRQAVAELKPGRISKELRTAVGMSDNETEVPPWITLMKEFGKPPSYKHYIIPGVDVEYTNYGYKMGAGGTSDNFSMIGETWGQMEEGEESGSESELEESSSDEGEVENQNLENDREVEAEDERPQRVEITEYSKKPTKLGDSTLPTKGLSGELYTVIKQIKVEDGNGLLTSKTAYELPTEE